MKTIVPYIHLLLGLLLCACGTSHPSLPQDCKEIQTQPRMLPDYTGVTIPVNIAPLNFLIDDPEIDNVILNLEGETYGGTDQRIILPADEWQALLQGHVGQALSCELYTRKKGVWRKHPAYEIHVVADTIDRFVSYRLIEPSYVAYENIAICQRDLTSFDESIILDNRDTRKEHCLNCHSYQNYHTDRMLLHVRGEKGGTMWVNNGATNFIQAMRRDSMISNPVYPAWHPTLSLVAFSTNHTGQLFHVFDKDKIEVQDTESELVLYDVDADRMLSIPSPKTEFETFPTWSPDGAWLYFCSAHYEVHDTTVNIARDVANNAKEVKYNIYRRSFDPSTRSFGERELVYDCAAEGQSGTLPRISPDGRYLLYASGDYGCFHIWHSHADIRMIDLTDGSCHHLDPVNSPLADSYPTWSSTGRWILLASRRNDGNYSRIYIAYFDRQGEVHKAFEIPQADPFYTIALLKSYNRPEPMVEAAPRLH